MGLYPPFRKVEHRPHLKITLADPESLLNPQKSVILADDFFWLKTSVGDVALQPIPLLVFRNPLLTDGDLYVLADFQELVVATFVDLVFGKPARLV